MTFKLFGKTILVVNIKCGCFFCAIHSGSEHGSCMAHVICLLVAPRPVAPLLKIGLPLPQVAEAPMPSREARAGGLQETKRNEGFLKFHMVVVGKQVTFLLIVF